MQVYLSSVSLENGHLQFDRNIIACPKWAQPMFSFTICPLIMWGDLCCLCLLISSTVWVISCNAYWAYEWNRFLLLLTKHFLGVFHWFNRSSSFHVELLYCGSVWVFRVAVQITCSAPTASWAAGYHKVLSEFGRQALRFAICNRKLAISCTLVQLV